MKQINKTWSVLKALDPKASANTVVLTAEVPAEDEADGDIVRVAGMECPGEMPLLAQHMKCAPDGSPTVLGKVSGFRNGSVMWKGNSIPAKLGDIEWADTELAKKYQQVFPRFMKDVSIGAEVLGQPDRIKDYGHDIKRCRVFELSIVTFGANPAAESVKAIKAALGDAIESEAPTVPDLVALAPAEIKKHIDIKLDEHTNGILAVLNQITKRLDNLEDAIVATAERAAPQGDPTPQADPKVEELKSLLTRLKALA